MLNVDFLRPLPNGKYVFAIMYQRSRFPFPAVTASTSAKNLIRVFHAIFGNVSSNTGTTSLPSYDRVEARSMDNDHQNNKDLFNEATNVENLSTNRTSSSRHFELVVKTVLGHIASFKK